MTSIVVQLIVITTYWSRDAFSLMLNLTSATTLIPYLFVAAYGLLIARRGETYDVRPEERQRDLIIAVARLLYTLFMLYAGGLTYILLAAVLFAPGKPALRLGAPRAGQAGLRPGLGLGDLWRRSLAVPSGIYGSRPVIKI